MSPQYWRKGGDTYGLHSNEALAEGNKCLETLGLKVRAITPNVRYGDIKYGVKGPLTVSKGLFEEMLKIDRGNRT